jgi:Tfp pilus assembly protein PilF
MAIEGPLRELGIHDVFQLLDLSAKTGVLRVSSDLRDDEGVLYFHRGRVVQATIRSKSMPVEMALRQAGRISDDDLALARSQPEDGRPDVAAALVRTGAISQRELERHYRLQLESAVFELMSWSEGFFSFEELPDDQMPHDSRISVSTESLLMEGARRIDEWSRIADVIPDLNVLLELAPFEGEHEGAALDLLPHEWQVLTMIDGERDLRAIATNLARSDFDVARVVFGLLSTGIVELVEENTPATAPALAAARAAGYMEQAKDALRGGDVDAAITAARMAVAASEQHVGARLMLARALACAGRHEEASAELSAALEADALNAEVHLEMGHCAARRGDLEDAATHWERYLRLAPGGTLVPRVRSAVEKAVALRCILQEFAYV